MQLVYSAVDGSINYFVSLFAVDLFCVPVSYSKQARKTNAAIEQ